MEKKSLKLTPEEKKSVKSYLADRINELAIDEEFLMEEDPYLLPALKKVVKILK